MSVAHQRSHAEQAAMADSCNDRSAAIRIFTKRSLSINLNRPSRVCYHIADQPPPFLSSQTGTYLMKLPRTLTVATCLLVLGCVPILAQDATAPSPKAQVVAAEAPFLVKPYIQLGHRQVDGKLVLVWHTTSADAAWAVEYKPGAGRRWETAEAPTPHHIAVIASLFRTSFIMWL